MEGPRALVNQTDVRVAVAEGDGNPAALKMRWSRRVHGDSPVVLVERIYDMEGELAGYRPVTGADLLSTKQQQALASLSWFSLKWKGLWLTPFFWKGRISAA